MTFKLVWKSRYGTEVIEEEIETKKEAVYLQKEYQLAYNEGVVSIKKETGR